MKRVAIYLVLVGLLGPGTAGARNLLFAPHHSEFIGLEFLRPEFEGESVSAGSFVLFGTVRRVVYEQIAVRVEASFTRYEPDAFNGVEYSLGNVYLGLEEERESSPYWWALGVQLPTISDKSSLSLYSGLLADVNRWEAFLPETVSLHVVGGYRAVNRNGLGVAVRLAPVLWAPTSGGGDPEVNGLYAAHFIFERPSVEFRAGLSGRIWITAGGGDLGDKTFHQLDLAVNAVGASISPGFHVRLPLDEGLSEDLKVVYGIQLQFKID